MTKQQVFISYRRDHDDALAGRIRDRMHQNIPDWIVFLDVDSIGAGADFRKEIDAQLAASSVFLALIGKRWIDEFNARLPDEDHVRYEIKSALKRRNTLKIIPVLVNDTIMPSRQALPSDVAELARLNATRIGRDNFNGDFARLVKEVTGREMTTRRSRIPALANIAKGVIAGGVSGFIALVVHYHTTGMAASEWIGDDGAALFLPACAAVGGLLGYWLAARPT